MSTDCLIRYDNNPQCVYYSGQLVSGCITLTTRKKKTIRGVHITIEGFATVKWLESRSIEKKYETIHYKVPCWAHEQYLSTRTYVAGRANASGFDLRPGSYSYNFQVLLPHQLPSSFEGEYGHILYQVILTIERPSRYDNVFKSPFTVISPLDLNLNPQYKIPICQEDFKTFWCCCCASRPITATINIPLSGYAAGQKLPFLVVIDNKSTKDCTNVRVKLERHAHYKCQNPKQDTRQNITKIVEKNFGAALKFSKMELNDFLELPSIAPTSLKTCSFIDITYWVLVVVHTPGYHSSLVVRCPVTIGTVPLIESATNRENVITMQPTSPLLSNEDSPPEYSSVVPPSYEDATALDEQLFVDEDDDKHAKVEPYVPKYPVYYNFVAPPSTDELVDTNRAASGAPC